MTRCFFNCQHFRFILTIRTFRGGLVTVMLFAIRYEDSFTRSLRFIVFPSICRLNLLYSNLFQHFHPNETKLRHQQRFIATSTCSAKNKIFATGFRFPPPCDRLALPQPVKQSVIDDIMCLTSNGNTSRRMAAFSALVPLSATRSTLVQVR